MTLTTVKYSDYRQNIKSGDVLAWTHRSWKTWYDIRVQAVRILTQSEYCHVGTAWVFSGRVFVIESVDPVIRIVPLSNLGSFYHVGMDLPWLTETENFAMSLVGIGEYSYIEAILALFDKKTEISSRKRWQCVKLVKAILASSNYHAIGLNTPSDLIRNLMIDGYDIRLIEA